MALYESCIFHAQTWLISLKLTYLMITLEILIFPFDHAFMTMYTTKDTASNRRPNILKWKKFALVNLQVNNFVRELKGKLLVLLHALLHVYLYAQGPLLVIQTTCKATFAPLSSYLPSHTKCHLTTPTYPIQGIPANKATHCQGSTSHRTATKVP